MLAEVTYNAGKSYRLKSYKFLQGKTVLVKDAAVVERCRATAGFSVRILTEAQAKQKKVPEAVRVKTVGSKTSAERKNGKVQKKKVRVPTAAPKSDMKKDKDE